MCIREWHAICYPLYMLLLAWMFTQSSHILIICCRLGIIGGLTSVITSTVEGVKTEGGVSGFFSGLGKGLVGTVTKPVAGALDFASETAQTVRDMASLSNHRYDNTASYSKR